VVVEESELDDKVEEGLDDESVEEEEDGEEIVEENGTGFDGDEGCDSVGPW